MTPNPRLGWSRDRLLSVLQRNSDEMGVEEGAVTRGGCGTQGGLFLQEKGSCSLLMFLQEKRETLMIQEREGEARPSKVLR